MSTKAYEVLVTASAIVLVIGAADEKEAYNFATQELSFGDFEDYEMRIEATLATEEEIARSRRHADAVSEPPKAA